MNKSPIEWCDRTWNAVTGCLHGCDYCYARAIVRRFGKNEHGALTKLPPHIKEQAGCFELLKRCGNPYPFGFLPTLHHYRLDEPAKIKKPKNIFVGSMADVFGSWVSSEWIAEVIKSCKAAYWHRYLFLTKNPSRYREFFKSPLDYRSYMWFGATATDTGSFVHMSEELLCHHTNSGSKTFLSIEPILGEIDPLALKRVKYHHWLIVGAETGRRPGVVPEREWIANIVDACRAAGVPVFLKNNLRSCLFDADHLSDAALIQEFPWDEGAI